MICTVFRQFFLKLNIFSINKLNKICETDKLHIYLQPIGFVNLI
jgi:hypothetical protein